MFSLVATAKTLKKRGEKRTKITQEKKKHGENLLFNLETKEIYLLILLLH